MNRKLHPDSSRAFTLIELLVVLSIVTLLVALLLPSLSKAMDASKKTTCGSNLRQLNIAMAMYLNDNRGVFKPTIFKAGIWPATVPKQANIIWENWSGGRAVGMGHFVKLGYVTGLAGFYCPSNTYISTSTDHGPVAAVTKYGTAATAYTDYSLDTILMEKPWDFTLPSNFMLFEVHPSFPVFADTFMQGDPSYPTQWNQYRPHNDEGMTIAYIDGSASYTLLSSIGNLGNNYLLYGTMVNDPTNYATWIGWRAIQRLRGVR